jgi:hypothetical protein
VLLLDRKAAFALDDMLWSRYQLFMQVYNHKTNVALNAMLAKAIPDALDDQRFRAPTDFQSYVEFTDDLVMSIVLSLCVRGRKLGGTVYGKTLAYRKVPLHLGFVMLATGRADEIERKTTEKAQERGIRSEDVITGLATSELIKPGPLPKLVSWDKPSGERRVEAFESQSSLFQGGGALPREYRLLHFYMQR